MDAPNAFLGKLQKPTKKEVLAALGTAAGAWTQLVDWLANEHGVRGLEWKSISPKYGWSLRLKRKDRTIVHLAPCAGCFRAAFIFGDRAVAAASYSGLPQSVLKAIANSPRYPEGTGIRLVVRKAGDLDAIRKLAGIKLAN